MSVRVALVCDLGPMLGSGHAMRCLALASELARQGAAPVMVTDLDSVPWVSKRVREAGVDTVSTLDPVREVLRGGFDAVVVDSYRLGWPGFTSIHGSGVPVVALVDGALRGASADLYVDPNLTDGVPRYLAGRRAVAGWPYALVRADVVAQRPAVRPGAVTSGTPRVLVVLGGTDPLGAVPDVVAAMVATRAAFDATAVAANAELGARVAGLPLGAGQSVAVIEPTDHLAALAARIDVVITAAGTTVAEMLCLGVATGVVRVADNQHEGYARVVAAGLAVGVGIADAPEPSYDTDALRRLLTDGGFRAGLAAAGWDAVDGRGCARVAERVLALAR